MVKVNLKFCTIFVFLFFLGIGAFVQAGTQVFDQEPKPNPYVDLIEFENGDFEQPDIAVEDIPGARYTAEEAALRKWNMIPMADVDGWYIEPLEGSGNHEHAYDIEIQISNCVPGLEAYDGVQMAEVNAGTMYQVRPTIGGQKIYWEFHHRGRGDDVIPDVLDFFLYGQQGQIGEQSILQGIEAADAFQTRASTTNLGWKRYYGSYLVPEGQESTVFAYQAISAAAGFGAGNYIDGIGLFYPSFLEVEIAVETESGIDAEGKLYALPGENAVYTITVENNGETATSRTRLQDILPDGVEIDLSSIKLVYINADQTEEEIPLVNQVIYDENSDQLQIAIGKLIENQILYDENGTEIPNDYANGTYSIEKGAAFRVTFSVKVTGEDIPLGANIRNQAKVIYNDLGYEPYNIDEATNQLQDEDNVSEVVSFIYKAKGSLEIEKKLTEPALENQEFVFRIEHRLDQVQQIRSVYYCTIILEKGQDTASLNLTGLPPGNYTVTEISGNWQYQAANPAQTTQSASINGISKLSHEFTFTNEYTDKAFISGKDRAVNSFKLILTNIIP